MLEKVSKMDKNYLQRKHSKMIFTLHIVLRRNIQIELEAYKFRLEIKFLDLTNRSVEF